MLAPQIFNTVVYLSLERKEMAIFSYLKLFLLDGVLQILALIYYYVPINWSRRFIEKIYALKGIKLTLASFVGKKHVYER
jgi:hypothetical protein